MSTYYVGADSAWVDSIMAENVAGGPVFLPTVAEVLQRPLAPGDTIYVSIHYAEVFIREAPLPWTFIVAVALFAVVLLWKWRRKRNAHRT
jgi:hypothetical protein